MKKQKVLSLFVLFGLFTCFPLVSTGTTYTANKSGTWTTTTIWMPNGTPGSGDNIIINTTYTVTLTGATSIGFVTISNGALELNGNTLTVTGVAAPTCAVTSPGQISDGGTGSITLNSTTSTTFTGTGNITANGTLTTTTTSILSGTGTFTIGRLTPNANTTINGTLTYSAAGNPCTISSNVTIDGTGTLDMLPSGGGSLNISGATVTIGCTVKVEKDVALLANNSVLTVESGGDIEATSGTEGRIRVAPTANANTSSITVNSGGTINISHGILFDETQTHQCNAFTYANAGTTTIGTDIEFWDASGTVPAFTNSGTFYLKGNVTATTGSGTFTNTGTLEFDTAQGVPVNVALMPLTASAAGNWVVYNTTSAKTQTVVTPVGSTYANLEVKGAGTATLAASESCSYLEIISGATFTTTGAFTINIGGNLDNFGTCNVPAGGTIDFNGVANSSINSDAGTYTIAGLVEMNMGSAAITLDVLDADFIAGINSGNKFYFSFTKGTWIEDNVQTLNNAYNNGSATALTINFGAIVQSNKGTMNLATKGTEGSILLEGELFLNGGTVTVGSSALNDLEYKVNGGTPELNVSSGTLNLYGGFNASSMTNYTTFGNDYVNFTMSGGTINEAVGGAGAIEASFFINNKVNGSVNMSGGTINLINPSTGTWEDLYFGGNALSSYSVTGGTVQFGTAATAASGDFWIDPMSSTAFPYPNLIVDKVLGGDTAVLLFPGTLTALSLTINTGEFFGLKDYTSQTKTNTLALTSTNGTYSWSNLGTFTPWNGTVEFIGSAAQYMNGNATSFYNLTINNSSAIAAGVTLNTNATVTNNLTLTAGVVHATAGTDSLIMAAGSASAGGSTSTYVDGPMEKIGGTAFTFPVGNGGIWEPIAIGATQNAINYEHFTAEYYRSGYGTYTLAAAPVPALTQVSSIEYWMLNRKYTSNVFVTLFSESAGGSGITNCTSNLVVAHYNTGTGKWENNNNAGTVATLISGTCGTATGVVSVVSGSAVTSFSPFTFGATLAATNPLPITLLNFNATYNTTDKVVDLDWATATETNNKLFTIERSTDGVNFTEITSLLGAGTTTVEHNYSTIDPSPLPGIDYYRLKQTDFDGNFTYSNTVPVNITAGEEFIVFPNPTSALENISCYSPEGCTATIQVTDMTGKVVADFTVDIKEGNNTISLSTDAYANGVYIINAVLGQKNYVKKFLKL